MQGPDMPAREKDAHLGSVVERLIYIQDRWMAVALCGLYSWTAGCVMVTEPNTRPTVVLTRHCIAHSQWRYIDKSF